MHKSDPEMNKQALLNVKIPYKESKISRKETII